MDFLVSDRGDACWEELAPNRKKKICIEEDLFVDEVKVDDGVLFGATATSSSSSSSGGGFLPPMDSTVPCGCPGVTVGHSCHPKPVPSNVESGLANYLHDITEDEILHFLLNDTFPAQLEDEDGDASMEDDSATSTPTPEIDYHAVNGPAVDIGSYNDPQLVGTFDEAKFSDRYQRNNKRSGLKNLRCFPCCSPVHQEKKYCGTSVQFRAVQTNMMYGQSEEYVAWGRFALAQEYPGNIKPFSVVSKSVILEHERKRRKPELPWYPGIIIGRERVRQQEVINIEFNGTGDVGWHYGWSASKYTGDQEHVFRVYIFKPIDHDQLLCVGMFDSPKFKLYCRRRHRVSRLEAQQALSELTLEIRPLLKVLYHVQTVNPDQANNNNSLIAGLASKMLSQDFTEKISSLSREISYRRDHGESIDTGFRRFLGSLREYIHSYCASTHGMSLEQIDAQLPNDRNPAKEMGIFRKVFRNLVDYVSPVKQVAKFPVKLEPLKENPDMDISPYLKMVDVETWKKQGFAQYNDEHEMLRAFIPSLNGVWIRGCADQFEKIKEIRSDWSFLDGIRSRIMDYMTQQIRVEFDSDGKMLRGYCQRMFFGTGYVEFPMDGNVYPFGVEDPLGIFPTNTITKQGFRVPLSNVFCFRNTVDDNLRVTRFVWANPVTDKLIIKVFHEHKKENKWVIEEDRVVELLCDRKL